MADRLGRPATAAGMKMVAKTDNADAERTGEATLVCAKCGHQNSPLAHHCGDCGAHLVVRCHSCGHRNDRAASVCSHCGHTLHRSLWRKWRKKLFQRGARLAPWQLVLLIVAVGLGFLLIVLLVEFRLRPIV